ncbi:hypothetical protein FVEG_00596 [Fusarium verticillioides 7600]|uniref:Uncharacterized protein n=1 Tax=Gibberella moniliformis (strain M3125 / FGSC 7600) TaxID=334819 RepID=W7LMP0_GIBM7|nr:hypothetical protein FVEG_00596 [Fusarium verticillioides 7600]EWG36679.1 hypothetical protein FVEG_00596 [Fusarium verticillioides 7600]
MKRLWDQAQYLPQETEFLLKHLQGYEAIFEILRQRYPNQQAFNMLPGFSLVQDNLRDSMEALESLRKNADYISTKLEAKTGLKRKLAALKIIIGKESSDELASTLKEAISMLHLAVQAWDFWLSPSVYELQSTPTGYGWTYNYRVYNVVSYESDIIQRIQKGDRAGVLELFGNRKASPFDKDEYGHSLLYWAATSKNFDMCQLLLSLGLHEALLEKVGKTAQAGALAPLVYDPDRHHPEKIWLKIADLFQSYINEPETSMVLRMFDCHNSCDHGDEYVRIFQQTFLPNFYNGPLIHRLEAFRLGSFHCQDSTTPPYLIARGLKISSLEVSESSRTGVSLMHSAAVAFSIRFADEVLPWIRGWAMWTMSLYNEGWGHLVREVASVARQEDLHTVEIVQPWDVYQVPTWKGTPLISVIGGALCYLSPDVSFFHWDNIFQGCIQKWVSILQESGVDLVLYGEQESINISKHFRAALDSDAIEASRNEVRNVLPSSSARLTFIRPERSGRKMWNSNH